MANYNTGSGLTALVSGDVVDVTATMERLIAEHNALPAEEKGAALCYLVVDLEEQVHALRDALDA